MEMQSIWSSTENFLPREPLKGDLTTDAAVIGGGMAGILTAYFLKQHGVEPVVLEAKTVGSGQTRRRNGPRLRRSKSARHSGV